jgi:DNA-binding response OmpR family regulator
MRQHALNCSAGDAMYLDLFSRKLVLVVEDEPLIALDVENQLRKAGARVIAAGYLDAALYMTEHPDLSAAVVDLRLGPDSAIPICRRLAHRNLPFVVYTGYSADAVEREWPSVPIIQKPATPDEITDALSHLFRPTHSSNSARSVRSMPWAPPRAP